jgi:IclR family transcriptional regulator, KDG regulon repressor
MGPTMSIPALAPGPAGGAWAGAEAGGLRSVAIATQVLRCFVEHEELGPTVVSRELGVAKSTAFHALAALAAAGLLERSGAGRYRLSLSLFHYGQLALDRLPLRAVARPVMMELNDSLRLMVQLGLPAGGHVTYVERVGNSGLGPLVSGEVMRRVAGYASSAGRAMAAFDPEIARATLAVPRVKHTPFTVTDTVRLERILATAKANGWVSSREESAIGYSSVAAPIFAPSSGAGQPRVAGAISAVGRTAVVGGARKDFVVAAVRRAAGQVTRLLAQTQSPEH